MQGLYRPAVEHGADPPLASKFRRQRNVTDGYQCGTATRPCFSRNRDFALLWSSQFVAATGGQARILAYPLLTLALTGSAFQAGLVSFVNYFALLAYVPAGHLVDTQDRKCILVCAGLLDAFALLSIPAAFALGSEPSLSQILVVAFVQGAAVETFLVAEQSALPSVVGHGQLGGAIAGNDARQ